MGDGTKAAAERLDALTGLRFLASAMIVVHHMGGHFGVPASPLPLFVGVMVFFVLSGFILTHVYPVLPSGAQVKGFLRARFARIWPLHAVCFVLPQLLYIPLPGSLVPTWLTTAAANLLLVQAWIPVLDFSLSFNAVSWSISVEAFFYAAFPLLILGLATNWPWKLLLAAGLVLFMAGLASALGLPDTASTQTTTTNLMTLNPLPRLLEFVFGMACCLAWKRWRHRFPASRAFASGVEVLLMVLLAVGMVYLIPFAYAVYPFIGAPMGEWIAQGGGLVAGAGVLIVVLAEGRGAVSWLLSRRPMVFLGEISFAIYMVHQIVQEALRVNAGGLAALGFPAGAAVYLAIVFAASVALHYGVERPARDRLRKAWG